MGKELKYKVKIKKHFDIEKEREITNYYVKKRGLLGWKYETYSSTDRGKDEVWVGLFFGTLLTDLVVTLLILALIGHFTQQHDALIFSMYHLYSMIFLRVMWYFLSNPIMKKDFESEDSAVSFIKDSIRKSTLEKYTSEKDILITYKEGKIEIEK